MIEIFVIVTAVEALVEATKETIGSKINARLASLCLSVFLCVLYQVNIIPQIGIKAPNNFAEYAGYILTGLIASRGSNFANSLIEKAKK